MSTWILVQCIVLAFYGYVVFRFCNGLLGSKNSPSKTATIIIICKICFNYVFLYKILNIDYYFSIFISQLGLILLILTLFCGSFPKKLALATVIYAIQELTAYAVVPLLTRIGDLIAEYVFGATLPMIVIYLIWIAQYMINCLIIYKLSHSCSNLCGNLPKKTALFLLIPSLFILTALEFASYLCNDRQVFLMLYTLTDKSTSSIWYQLADPVILFLISAMGLIANLIIVFGTNHTMLQLLKEQQLSMQVEHYETLERQSQQLQKFRHDLNNHIISIQGLISENKIEETKDYLSHIAKKSTLTDSLIKTGNHIADALLSAKCHEAHQNGIDFNCDISLPISNMDNFDISVILGNAIDNAVEACKRMTNPYQKKFIIIQSSIVKNYLILEIKNSAENDAINSTYYLKTKKRNTRNHGIGLKSLKETVEKYHGTVDFSIQPDSFCLSIMLPR
ncbi:MAG: sensor histidine kinase [Aminipila sp.]